MKPMKKIPFKIEINISQVPNRFCRFYQEQIYEYTAEGKARFEWDRIKQEYIIYQNPTILDVCDPCPLNILLEAEGCKGELYEFDTFLKVLGIVKHDSIILQKNALNCEFTSEETEQLIREMEDLQDQGKMLTWPVAQVFFADGSPAVSEESFKSKNLVYYEWSGDDNDIYVTSNKGYHIGLTGEGIILKKNYGETIEETFNILSRKGMRVTGQTVAGKKVPIPMNRTQLPEWFPDDPGGDSELRFTELPISDVFRDVFDMIIVFGKAAMEHFTGVNIFSEFYRRA